METLRILMMLVLVHLAHLYHLVTSMTMMMELLLQSKFRGSEKEGPGEENDHTITNDLICNHLVPTMCEDDLHLSSYHKLA